jgi:ribosome modulation factor
MRTSHCVLFLATALMAVSPSIARAQSATRNIETDFLWSYTDAEKECPRVAAEAGGKWNGQWRMSTPGKTSICEVTDIKPPGKRNIEAGPIWNQADAQTKCPRVAAEARGRWTGQWRTTQAGRMSVCEVEPAPVVKARDVEAGPIWNQADAQIKCPVAAFAVRGTWTGQWRTVAQGQMSVCEIADRN